MNACILILLEKGFQHVCKLEDLMPNAADNIHNEVTLSMGIY